MIKNFRLLLFAIVAIAVVSCSSDESQNLAQNNNAGESSQLKIELSNSIVSRAAADAPDTEDMAINDLAILVFRSGGALDVPIAFYDAAPTNNELTMDVTTAAKTVYIVANSGATADQKGILANVTTVSQLDGVVGDLMSSNVNVSNIQAGNVWMTGAGTVSIFTPDANSGVPTASSTVILNFPLSKIRLVVKDERTNTNGGKNYKIEDNDVMILYAGAQIPLFASEKDNPTSFYTGSETYSRAVTPRAVLSTALCSDVAPSGFTKNPTSAVSHHFYVAANDASTQPTILALRSTLTDVKANTQKDLFYPIQFNTTDAKYTLEAGSSYLVTITLKGDIDAGEGGGTDDPETEILPANLDVTVVPADWTAVDVGKVFN